MFKDLLIYILPRFLTIKLFKVKDYAFIVHPRGLEDVFLKFLWLKYLPKSMIFFITKHLWPITVAGIKGFKDEAGKELNGIIIATPLTAEQLLANRSLARRKIIRAAKAADKREVKIIGLGAMSTSLTDGGQAVKGKIKAGITTGHALTSWSVATHLLQAAEKLGISLQQKTLAVVGAAGSIGSNSVKLVVEKQLIGKIILIDMPHKSAVLNELRQELFKIRSTKVDISTDLDIVNQADFIIAATSAPSFVLHNNNVKPGTVIVNDAQPSDVAPELMKRPDILVIEGGVLNIAGLSYNFNMGLHNAGDVFSCLAEVVALSYVHWQGDYAIGRLNKELITKVSGLAKKIGVKLGEWQNPLRKYSVAEIYIFKKFLVK